MPQTQWTLAKTHKELMRQKFLDTQLGAENFGHIIDPVVYMGRTTGNTPAEIFVGGKAHTGTGNVRRIVLPESSIIMFEAYAIAYNRTDNLCAHAARYYGGFQNLAGTLTGLVDYDLVTGGSQPFVRDPVVAAVAQGMNLAPSSTAVVFAATGDEMTVTVTGITAKVVDWKVFVIPYTICQTTDFFYSDTAAGNGI